MGAEAKEEALGTQGARVERGDAVAGHRGVGVGGLRRGSSVNRHFRQNHHETVRPASTDGYRTTRRMPVPKTTLVASAPGVGSSCTQLGAQRAIGV